MALGNRRACQQGECRPDHRRLAQSVNCVIEHAGEGLEKVAGRLAGEREIHYSKSALYQFANAYQADASVRVPLCVVDAIEELSGSTVVTEALARRRGGRFVPLPRVDAGATTDLQQQKTAIKEFAEAIQGDAMSPEARIEEIEQAITALLVMRETELARLSSRVVTIRPAVGGVR